MIYKDLMIERKSYLQKSNRNHIKMQKSVKEESENAYVKD